MPQSAGKTNPPTWIIHCLMLIASVLVATSFTVGKAIASGLDPAVLTLLRFSLAVLLFFPYVRKKFDLTRPSLAAFFRYSIISGALVGFFWLMFISLQYTSALNTGVIFTLVPGISGVYSAILFKERLGKYRLGALVLALIGALIVIFHGDIDKLLAMQLNSGDLIFFAGCLLMAFYTPLIKLLHRGEPMAIMTFWVLVTGCCWLLLLSGYRLFSIPWLDVAPQIYAGIIYLAIFCTIITFFLTKICTMYIGPTRVMAYSYLYPPLVILIDWVAGHALPPAITLFGVFIIIPSLVIVQMGAGKYNSQTP